MEKRKIAFIIDYCEEKGVYSCERAALLAASLQHESLFIFIKDVPAAGVRAFTSRGLTPVFFDYMRELPKVLRNLQIHCLFYEGKNSSAAIVQALRPFCKTIVHFDDFGDGAQLVNCNIVTLYDDQAEPAHHTLSGFYSFAIPEPLAAIAEHYHYPPLDALPHIVIAFEDGDPHNLTYRTLRHLTELHIPLDISLVLDEHYAHDEAELQLLALSRRHTTLIKGTNALYETLPKAHIVICNASYTAYKVATLGIPCIAAAQHERELTNSFVRESNGLIHLGLGRKMKQSHIQNAVMELLLHDSRRERAMSKQRRLKLAHNNEFLLRLVHDFAYDTENITHI